MKLAGRIVVVTGGARGIGAALCRRFAEEGAARVIVVDTDRAGAQAVARSIDGDAKVLDVSDRGAIDRLVAGCLEAYGRIDLFCSNAGVIAGSGLGDERSGPFAGLDAWRTSWDVNVMAQVHAARAVLPSMLARGEGAILNTASAAGLLSDIGSLPYSVTKHASVGLSEWLAITYGERGILVCCLCPMGVNTPMVDEAVARGTGRHLTDGLIEPEALARHVVEGLAEERFLILPHPEVAAYVQRKASDPERWLRGMQRLRARLFFAEDPDDRSSS